jgi:hypothetical protein
VFYVTAECQHPDGCLEHHQQADEENLVRRDDGPLCVGHPREMRRIREAGVITARSEIDDMQECPADDEEHTGSRTAQRRTSRIRSPLTRSIEGGLVCPLRVVNLVTGLAR